MLAIAHTENWHLTLRYMYVSNTHWLLGHWPLWHVSNTHWMLTLCSTLCHRESTREGCFRLHEQNPSHCSTRLWNVSRTCDNIYKESVSTTQPTTTGKRTACLHCETLWLALFQWRNFNFNAWRWNVAIEKLNRGHEGTHEAWLLINHVLVSSEIRLYRSNDHRL